MAFLATEALARLQQAHERERLAHAYLVTGPDRDLLENFARDFAELVLGASGGHAQPDLHEVRPESKSRRILTAQMRELEEALRLKPLRGSRKVGVIMEAERMMPAAANAFLKTLEEPPSGTHLLLVSLLPDQLLTTIVSRCLEVSLRAEGAAPLSARQKRAGDLARELLAGPEPAALADIFRAVRQFQALLSEVRAEATAEMEATLKSEKEQYQNRTESKWLEEQEEKLTALTEGAVLRERAVLVQALGDVLAERLREATAGVDARIHFHHSAHLLRQLEAVERLRSDLDRTMNETLAIEAGFLEIFASPSP